jgi:hypothetical protein
MFNLNFNESLSNKMIREVNNSGGLFTGVCNYDFWVNPALYGHCTKYKLKIEEEVKEMPVVKVPKSKSSTKKRKIRTRSSVSTLSDSSDEDPIYNYRQKKIKNPYKSTGCRNNFRNDVIDILKTWYKDHIYYPYPDQADVEKIADLTGLAIVQIKNWFTNYRTRVKNKN